MSRSLPRFVALSACSFESSGTLGTQDWGALATLATATQVSAMPGDELAGVRMVDLAPLVGASAEHHPETVTRKVFDDGSWAIDVIAAPAEGAPDQISLTSELRLYPSKEAAIAGFQFVQRSQKIDLGWTELAFEPPSAMLPSGERFNIMVGGQMDGGTAVVMMVSGRDSAVLTVMAYLNAEGVAPDSIDYSTALQPARDRVWGLLPTLMASAPPRAQTAP